MKSARTGFELGLCLPGVIREYSKGIYSRV